jgi:hypothetical protein
MVGTVGAAGSAGGETIGPMTESCIAALEEPIGEGGGDEIASGEGRPMWRLMALIPSENTSLGFRGWSNVLPTSSIYILDRITIQGTYDTNTYVCEPIS